MGNYPKYEPDTLQDELDNLSRGPFRRVLAKLLKNAPSEDAISKQAEAHPDRWGQTTALIARLGGYNEKLEIEGSLNLKIQTLSDLDLASLLSDLQHQLDMQSSGTSTQVIDKTEGSS